MLKIISKKKYNWLVKEAALSTKTRHKVDCMSNAMVSIMEVLTLVYKHTQPKTKTVKKKRATVKPKSTKPKAADAGGKVEAKKDTTKAGTGPLPPKNASMAEIMAFNEKQGLNGQHT